MKPIRSLLERVRGEKAPAPRMPGQEAAASGTRGLRDTDEDWRRIGEEQPFWGVLTEDKYRAEAMTPEALELFYKTGRDDVELFADLIRRASDRPPQGGSALDFGCGTGRLAEAMRDHVDHVVGVDISPGMLAQARKRSGRVDYVGDLPDGPFDWINSYIVFQHMPPAKGLEMVERLLQRLAPDGAVSLQFPFSHEGFHDEAAARAEKPADEADVLVEPAGVMQMYDYNLNAVLALFWRYDLRRWMLRPTDHGGHYGFIIAGRRGVHP